MELATVATLTFFLGLILGHWLTLGRDKRKEFNEVSSPIRAWILSEMAAPSPQGGYPSVISMDTFESYLNPLARKRFRAACKAMIAARERQSFQSQASGDMLYKEAGEVGNAFSRMLPFTKRR